LARFYGQLLDSCPTCRQEAAALVSFETLQRGLKAEWELLTEKAGALVDAWSGEKGRENY